MWYPKGNGYRSLNSANKYDNRRRMAADACECKEICVEFGAAADGVRAAAYKIRRRKHSVAGEVGKQLKEHIAAAVNGWALK
jgi:hypothetical protein